MDGDSMLLQEAIAEISRRARGEDGLQWVGEKVSSLSPPVQQHPLNCWAERCNNLQQEALGDSKVATSRGVNWMVPEVSNCWSSMAISMITPLTPLQLMPYEGGAIGSCFMEIVKSMWSSKKKQSQDSSFGLEAEQVGFRRTPSSELEDNSRPSSSAVSSFVFHAPDSSVDEDDSFIEDGSSTVWEWEFSKYDNMDQACFPCWNASSSDLDEFLTALSKQSSDGSDTADELVCGGYEKASFATSPVNSGFVFIPSPYYSHNSAAEKLLRSVLKTSSCYCPRPEKRRPKRVRFWDEQEEACCAESCTSEDSTDDECFSLNYVSPIWAEVSSNSSSSSSNSSRSSRSSNEWRTGVCEDHLIE